MTYVPPQLFKKWLQELSKFVDFADREFMRFRVLYIHNPNR